jgi:drug/metabolite transporter (DMT)-like permease
MTAIVLALTASVAWGVSDFLGGMRTRTLPVAFVLLASQAVGLLVALAALAAQGSGPDHGGGALVWAPVAGVLSVAALALLYRALARGPIMVVAPIAATGAVVPAAIGIARGDATGAPQLAGLLAALGGAALAATPPDDPDATTRARAGARTAAALAGLAAAAGGAFLVAFDRAGAAGALWATSVMRLAATAASAALLVALLRRSAEDAPDLRRAVRCRPLLAGLVGLGVADIVADLAYALGTRVGDLSVVAVLSNLYPVVNVALAVAVLRERAAPRQLVGGALALSGIAVVAGSTG